MNRRDARQSHPHLGQWTSVESEATRARPALLPESETNLLACPSYVAPSERASSQSDSVTTYARPESAPAAPVGRAARPETFPHAADVMELTPVRPITASVRPPMPSVRPPMPSVRPPMSPMIDSAAHPHPAAMGYPQAWLQDPSVDTPWVLPTARPRTSADATPTAVRPALSVAIAMLATVVGLAAVIAGVFFLRSGDHGATASAASAPPMAFDLPTPAPRHDTATSSDTPKPALAPSVILAPANVRPTTPAPPLATAATPKPALPAIATPRIATPTTHPVIAKPVEAMPAKAPVPKKNGAKPSPKSVEAILNELGEEQLRR